LIHFYKRELFIMLRQASLVAGRCIPLLAASPGTRIPGGTLLVAHQNWKGVRSISTPNDGFDKQGSYEGTGKTTISILNQDLVGINLIDSYSSRGFRLNDDTFVIGPSIIFPTGVLKWNVMGAADITMESLSLFTLLEPKPDLIVIGHGEDTHVRDPVSIKVILGLKKKGIPVECLATEKAVTTYNYLMEEGRVVAAALIPPSYIKEYSDQDLVDTKSARQELYTMKENALYHDRTSRKKWLREERKETKEALKILEDKMDKQNKW
jgi:NADH dehydrogenase [ubiquinone] 1 alpha subcomplex assembly factor 3